MDLARPLALAVLPVALALLWWLERRRRRPPRVVVASVDLFVETKEIEDEARRARRRASRELVLKALAVTLLTFAAADPGLAANGEQPRSVTVLLDRGVSMGALDEGGTRLELAKGRVHEVLARLAPQDRVTLVLAPATAPDETLGRDDARAALSRVTPVEAPSDFASVLTALGAPLVARAGAGDAVRPIVAVSDRPPSAAPEVLATTALALVGTPLANRAVVAVGSGRDARGLERLVVTVVNHDDLRFAGKVVVKLAESADNLERGIVRERELAIECPANGLATSLLEDEFVERCGALSVELRGARDALVADDRAFAVRSAPPRARVALVGDLPASVRLAVRATPDVDVIEAASLDVARGVDLIVYAGRDLPPGLPPPPVLIFSKPTDDDASPVSSLMVEKDRGAFPHTLEALASEPPVVNQAFARVPFELMLKPLVSSIRQLIGWTGSGEDRVVWVGFWPEAPDSNWSKQRSFPIFIAEVIEDARAARAGSLVSLPTGRPFRAPLRAAEAELSAPSGERRRVSPANVTLFETGLHRLAARTRDTTGATLLASGVLDPRATDLRRASPAPFDPARIAAVLAPAPPAVARRELAPVAALLALALAAAAWQAASSARARRVDGVPGAT